MTEITFSIILSVIVSVCAFFSGIIIAAINNSHQLKMKKLELSTQAHTESKNNLRAVYENYLRHTSKKIHSPSNPDTNREYGESYGLALVYFPEELYTPLVELNKAICSKRPEVASDLFDELSIAVRKEICKL